MKFNDFIAEAKEELKIKPLKFARNALEPILSKKAIDIHWALTKGYFKKYEDTGDSFQKAGAVLHNFWWEQFCPPVSGTNEPKGRILELILKKFKSYPEFIEKFNESALGVHGSAWTVLKKDGTISIIPNHKIESDLLLIIDSWEHSMVDYLPVKKDYYKNIWQIIDWDFIQSRL